MKLLFIIAGGSFRIGSTQNRNYGSKEAYNEQIRASKSHIDFINHLKNKYNILIDVIISTYSTDYDNDLINIYSDYIIDKNLFKYDNGNGLKGIHNIFRESYKHYLKDYDAVLFFRIDIILKQKLFDIFNPYCQKILFPFILSKINVTNRNIYDKYPSGHPKHSDMLLFIPKKYFNIINIINIGHGTWEELVGGECGFVNHGKNILTYDDFDCMIYSYHDSDSEKDWNPLYYTVNRGQADFKNWIDMGIFDKNNYNYI